MLLPLIRGSITYYEIGSTADASEMPNIEVPYENDKRVKSDGWSNIFDSATKTHVGSTREVPGSTVRYL